MNEKQKLKHYPTKLNLNYLNGTAKLYYTGSKFPSIFNILSFKYFAPYYNGGIYEYYEIIGIRSAKKKEMQRFEEGEIDGIRFFFELGKCFKISEPITKMTLISDTYQKILVKDLLNNANN